MGQSLSDFDLSGKCILLTGASGGIGVSIAEKLVDHGAVVVLTGRSNEKLETLKGVLNSKREGACLGIIQADLSVYSEVVRLGKDAEALAPIDVLINCAGIVHPGPALEKTELDWDRTFDVNLKAAFILTKTLVPHMIQRGGGKIVMVGSTGGMRGLPERVAYASSKGGMIMLTKQLAVEWGSKNIRVNLVAPTVVMTPMAEEGWADPARREAMLAKIPAGRFPNPTDVANAVVYLSSPAADILNGVILPVDGGLMA